MRDEQTMTQPTKQDTKPQAHVTKQKVPSHVIKSLLDYYDRFVYYSYSQILNCFKDSVLELYDGNQEKAVDVLYYSLLTKHLDHLISTGKINPRFDDRPTPILISDKYVSDEWTDDVAKFELEKTTCLVDHLLKYNSIGLPDCSNDCVENILSNFLKYCDDNTLSNMDEIAFDAINLLKMNEVNNV